MYGKKPRPHFAFRPGHRGHIRSPKRYSVPARLVRTLPNTCALPWYNTECTYLPSSPPPPLSLSQPENLLLASRVPGASVKLADFGLAVEAMDGKHYYGKIRNLHYALNYHG